jgi:hypothetical protein
MDTLRRIAAFSITVMLLFGTACCDEKRSPEPYWPRAMDGYWLQVFGVKLGRGDEVIDLDVQRWNGKTYVVNLPALRVDADANAGLELWFRNESERPVFVDWANITYVDETGQHHETFSWQMGARRSLEEQLRSEETSETLEPSDGIWRIVRPVDKTYRVYWGTFCENTSQYSELLLPWNFGAKTEAELQQYVEESYEKQLPVLWLVPIEIGGESFICEIQMNLQSEGERGAEIDNETLEYEKEGKEPPWVRKGHP